MLLRYIFRRPVILVGSALSVLLAASLVIAASLAADSVVYGIVMSRLERVKVDVRFYIFLPLSDVQRLWNVCKSLTSTLDEVVAAEFYLSLWCYVDGESADLALVPSNASRLTSMLSLSHSVSTTDVFLSSELAVILGKSRGDEVVVNVSLEERGYILERVRVVDVLKVEEDIYESLGLRETFAVGFLSPWLTELANTTKSALVHAQLLVWLDREKVINPWDLLGSSIRVWRLAVLLGDYIERQNLTVISHVSPLASELYQMLGRSMLLRGQLFLVTLPVLIMGFVLGLLANYILIGVRKREIGLLRVRGATGRQIRNVLLLEGLIAGGLGGALGFLTALFLADWFVSMSAGVSAVPVWNMLPIVFEPYFIASLVIGLILGFLSTFPPARRAAKLPLVEALAEYTMEIERETWRPKWSLILYAISIYGLFELASKSLILNLVGSAIFRARIFFLFILYIPLVIAELIGTLAGPFIFMYFTAKLIAFRADKLRKVFSALVRPVAGELSEVAVRNFARRPARIARALFLITLMFGSVIAVATLYETSLNTRKVDLKFTIGADIRVDVPFIRGVDWRSLFNVSGVEAIVRVAVCPTAGGPAGVTWIVVALDREYFTNTFFRADYLVDTSLSEVLSEFSGGKALLSISAKKYHDFTKGDVIEVEARKMKVKVEVIGFVKFLPGVTGWTGCQGRDTIYVIVPFEEWAEVDLLLIDVSSEYNPREVASEIKRISEERLGVRLTVLVYEEELEKELTESLHAAVLAFMRVSFSVAIAMAFIGTLLIFALAAIERSREIALLRARGTSRRKVIAVFVAESFLMMVVSMALALAAGLPIAMLAIPSPYMLDPATGDLIWYELPPEMTLVISPTTITFCVIGALALVAASMLLAWLATKRNLADVLRIHH